MVDIQLRGELWDNDSADVLRWWGFRDITAPMDIQAALDAAAGDDVTLLINSLGGDMAVGNEIRSMLRRYSGDTTALFQGMGASAATLAASGCRVIQSEPGALLYYHNPMGQANGDFREMQRSANGLEAARDGILEVYLSRPGVKASREELVELMDRDTWINPSRALGYGLIDGIVGTDGEIADPAAFVAAAGHRIRLTETMRHRYQDHLAEERKQRDEAVRRALAKARALTNF